MFRKLVVLLLIGGGIAYAVNHTRIGRHVVTVFNRTVDSVEDSIAPEVELTTLKRDLKKLESEQVKIQGRYATAKVDAERLLAQVTHDRKNFEGQEASLIKRGEELKKAGNTERVSWGGVAISMVEGKERLQIAVDQYKAKKAQIHADEARLGYLEKDRDTLGQQLHSFRAETARLHGEIARLQSEIHLLKAEQLRSRLHPEGSDLGDLKESFDRLARKIAIEREKLSMARDGVRSEVGQKSVDEILGGLKDAEKVENQN